MMERWRTRRTRRVSRAARISMGFVFLGMVVMILVVYGLFSRIFVSNVELDAEHEIFYIPTGTTFEQVVEGLAEQGIIENSKSFRWVAGKKGYPSRVIAGRYKIPDGMSNNDLVNMLRSGRQDPVMVVFNNVRSLEQMAGRVTAYLESDSATFSEWLTGDELPGRYGFEKETFSAMFIPNTYEFFWNTSPEEFTDRMKREYEKFWKGERDRKAKRMEMNREEVVTLASIVDEETLFDDENARVAGVYVNRLHRGIPLQADPTLRYISGDFTRQRVLNKDKLADSPYNTYRNKGLPPGPISIPSIAAIDGVLNYEDHNYLYFCAKADFSGYHAFARTLQQHNRNARAYRQALNRNRIYR